MTYRMLAAIALAAFATTASVTARSAGYIAPGTFDILAVLPPAPVKGDSRYQADRKIFRKTRHLIGTPRFAMATRDKDYSTPALIADFSCAVGVSLTPANAPKTTALVSRAMIDTAGQMIAAKNYYKRQRPFLIDHGEICDDKAELAKSYDYPSGHATLGWTWALILADLAPDRATDILARGRAFGESRLVCGAHNASAVEGARLTAGATMDVIQSSPAFQADATAARAELTALRNNPSAARPSDCDAERKLVAQPVL